eukprot:659955-Ditylum_brightwellii.AAC.1
MSSTKGNDEEKDDQQLEQSVSGHRSYTDEAIPSDNVDSPESVEAVFFYEDDRYAGTEEVQQTSFGEEQEETNNSAESTKKASPDEKYFSPSPMDDTSNATFTASDSS